MKISVNQTELPLVRELKSLADKNDGVIRVAVHNGRFHADELCAIAILKEALPDCHLQVTRTRRPNEIAENDIAIDVGGGRFDHHHETMRYQNSVPMAACGKILAAVEPSQAMINILNKMSFYAVQAIDNGERVSLPRECQTNLFDWVAAFNPTFEERTPSDGEYYERFFEALDIVRRIYRRMRANAKAQINANSVLRRAPQHIHGKFIELPVGGVPWYQCINDWPNVLGVIHKDVEDGTWKLTVAPKYPGAKENKVSFPSSWGGLEGQALEIASKIPGAQFCHLGLHFASFKTRDAALHAARLLAGIHQYESTNSVF